MEKNEVSKRLTIGMIIVLIFFSFLLYRLYLIQVEDGEELAKAVTKQRGSEFLTYPKRGIIFDRNLYPITNNEKESTIIVERDIIINDKSLYQSLLKESRISKERLDSLLDSKNKLLQIPINNPSALKNQPRIFNVDLINRYRKDNLLAHVIGYINQADNKGQAGIEYVYDEFLNNDDRKSFMVEYDRDRNIILGGSQYTNKTSDRYDPTAVQLTIDLNLQKEIEKILDEENYNGAIIVNDISNGEILSMVSRPNYNQENINKDLERKDLALYNRAIQVAYPPGSIFKLVVLLASLEEDENIEFENFYCPGYEIVNDRITNCSRIHGHLNLKEAFAQSCNTVFIQLGKRIGAEKIIDMARRLGFGLQIDIGLAEETEGNLPEANELLGGAIRNIAIGQGSIEVTPLQVSNLLTIIGNKGVRRQISLVKGITNNEGFMIKNYFKNKDERLISRKNSELVINYMEEVINTGTARSIDLTSIGGGGGKTGTAEAVYNEKNTVHGWFAGFYPAKEPKYSVVILIENTSKGSITTLPIFKKIALVLAQYLH